MMDATIRELADKLGQAMARSEQARRFKQLRAAAAADKDAQAMLKAYQEQLDLLARKEHSNQPIEVEDKRKLKELQEKTYAHDKLKALMAAQADYVELVQQVNDVLGHHLVGPDEPTEKAKS